MAIAISVFENANKMPLSKHLSLDTEGKLIKSAVANLAHGRVTRRELSSLSEVCSLMRDLPPHCAAAFGVSKHYEALVFSKQKITEYQGNALAITRTRDHFDWASDVPGMLLP